MSGEFMIGRNARCRVIVSVDLAAQRIPRSRPKCGMERLSLLQAKAVRPGAVFVESDFLSFRGSVTVTRGAGPAKNVEPIRFRSDLD